VVGQSNGPRPRTAIAGAGGTAATGAAAADGPAAGVGAGAAAPADGAAIVPLAPGAAGVDCDCRGALAPGEPPTGSGSSAAVILPEHDAPTKATRMATIAGGLNGKGATRMSSS
jgi:hypothetical protein